MPSRPRALLATAAVGLGAFVAWHLVLDFVGGGIEARGANLWGRQGRLRLFHASVFGGRDPGRLLLTGASEAREGFVLEPFEEALPRLRAVSYTLAAGTLEDVVLAMQYAEGAYGPDTLPEKLVLGTSFRMVMNYVELENTPLQESIDRYSPCYGVDLESEPHRLVRKGPLESVASRYRYAGYQSLRYRRTLRTVADLTRDRLAGKRRSWTQMGLAPASNHRLPPHEKQQYWDGVRRGDAWYWRLATLHPSERADRIRLGFHSLLSLADRHGTDVYVVNLPEGPWTELFYEEGVYDEYLEILREAVGDTPYLDLRRLLREDEFHDFAHANRAGAVRLSERVARFVAETDRERDL